MQPKELQQFIDEKKIYLKEKYGDELELLYEELPNFSFRLMLRSKDCRNSHSWLYMGAISPVALEHMRSKFDDKAHEISEAKWK